MLCYALTFGVNAPVCRQALTRLRREGTACSLIVVESLYPIPVETINKALSGVTRCILPEMNLGQYAESLRPTLHKDVELIQVNRVNGELISIEDILDAVAADRDTSPEQSIKQGRLS